MNWLTATILAMLLFGIFPIFGNKAGKIHGAGVNFVIDTGMMLILAVFIGYFYRHDFGKITRTSFLYSLGLGLSSIGFILFLYAWSVAPPDKFPLIGIILSFSAALTAIIAHFLGVRLSTHQWAGVLLALSGIVLINVDHKTISRLFSQ